MTQFSGAEKRSLCFLSSGCCFFLVFSETHSSPVLRPQSPNPSQSKPCTTRGSYPCSCISPTGSFPPCSSLDLHSDPLVVWLWDFTQCLVQDARGQWLLFQPCLSEKPGYLPAFIPFICQPRAALASLPSVSPGFLFPFTGGPQGAVQIPNL